MPAPLDLPVAEMAARVADRDGALKAADLVDASFARIRALDGTLHAFLHVAEESARRAAADVDARVARGDRVGPLAGVPLAVKDNIAVAGMPLTCGSRVLGHYVAPRDATVVARARAAGAVVVGKTNLDEFAMGSSTENSAFGPTKNPYDLSRVPGGSSGGSAAAVAAGLVPLALGSETGGSVRQPAALCGIVGHKPTYGRVSRSGLVAFASSLDQVGPFGRSVEDAALLQRAIEGVDRDDATTCPLPALSDAPVDLASLRIGVSPDLGSGDGGSASAPAAGDPRVARRIAEVIGRLPRKDLVSVRLPSVHAGIATYYLVAPAECSSNLARFDGVRYGARVEAGEIEALYAKSRDAGFGAEVKRRIVLGTFALSAGYADQYYKQAMRVRSVMRDELARAFTQCDVILSATSPFPAFRLGERADDPLAMYLSDVLTVSANLAGTPAISVPVGTTDDGLPIGLQVWAPAGRDDLCFAVAAAVRETTGMAYRPPSVAKGVA